MVSKITKRTLLAILQLSTLFWLTACQENLENPVNYTGIGYDRGRRPEDAKDPNINLQPTMDKLSQSGYFSDNNSDFSNSYARSAANKNTPNYHPAPVQQPAAAQGYYYVPAQPTYYPAQGGYYVPAQQYAAPQNYQPYVVPGSRYYTNPYDIPPAPQYPQYDSDQYYVPPARYNNANHN